MRSIDVDRPVGRDHRIHDDVVIAARIISIERDVASRCIESGPHRHGSADRHVPAGSCRRRDGIADRDRSAGIDADIAAAGVDPRRGSDRSDRHVIRVSQQDLSRSQIGSDCSEIVGGRVERDICLALQFQIGRDRPGRLSDCAAGKRRDDQVIGRGNVVRQRDVAGGGSRR